jgi:hypothetical protein
VVRITPRNDVLFLVGHRTQVSDEREATSLIAADHDRMNVTVSDMSGSDQYVQSLFAAGEREDRSYSLVLTRYQVGGDLLVVTLVVTPAPWHSTSVAHTIGWSPDRRDVYAFLPGSTSAAVFVEK